ncbi:MAG TPA: ATP-dependent DNA ligase [Pyrinomonadaceae bacterium]|nr:ATP-dependent DNA ligase [Pyrinomonadaceae bacterium]
MKLFTELYTELEQTNKTNEKVEALKFYFECADARDAAWALYFLSGRKPRQIVPSKKLREWAIEISQVPEWLYDESRDTVGDGAETIALLLPNNSSIDDTPLHVLVEERLVPLRGADETIQYEEVLSSWQAMNYSQRLVYNKLISGSFRVGVSQLLVTRALAQLSDVPTDIIAQRLMGDWQPTAEFYEKVVTSEMKADERPIARPFPFHLAHQIDFPLEKLGEIKDWQAEWKWDGIRVQVIKRESQVFLWSRGEDLISERFPEIAEAAAFLPEGTVLDGEILPWRDDSVLPFTELQRRIGRKNISDKMLAEVPVIVQVYDLLEFENEDMRTEEFEKRRKTLEQIITSIDNGGKTIFRITDSVRAESWKQLTEKRENSRSLKVEGLMLKKLDSPYRVGRHRGDWWKWKIDPFTIDAVLLYAQKGTGKRANLFTDYTFAVWKEGELVPFAKAYSGLTDKEIRKVDKFVRDNTKETFGPVRSVLPKLVFELAFEAIQKSSRHKSGVAVRFPRILRWRDDKAIEEADSLEAIHALLEGYEAEGKK